MQKQQSSKRGNPHAPILFDLFLVQTFAQHLKHEPSNPNRLQPCFNGGGNLFKICRGPPNRKRGNPFKQHLHMGMGQKRKSHYTNWLAGLHLSLPNYQGAQAIWGYQLLLRHLHMSHNQNPVSKSMVYPEPSYTHSYFWLGVSLTFVYPVLRTWLTRQNCSLPRQALARAKPPAVSSARSSLSFPSTQAMKKRLARIRRDRELTGNKKENAPQKSGGSSFLRWYPLFCG